MIREERAGERAAIARVVSEAFAIAAHSSGSEAIIVDSLRAEGALTFSLVACLDGHVVGHIAVSPVRINGAEANWFGLGPISVRPDYQRQGLGRALIEAALVRLTETGAEGCVVVGDPAYYGRFGFEHHPQLSYAKVAAPFLQLLSFTGERPAGVVTYHPAFDGD